MDNNGGKVNYTISDNGDGSYPVKYTTNNSGKHIITIDVHNSNVAGSPFTVNVSSVVDPNSTTVSGKILYYNIISYNFKFYIRSRHRKS